MVSPPVFAYETGRLLYVPYIAASKDRIVSKGRSNRGRVGLERSGSAEKGEKISVGLLYQRCQIFSTEGEAPTNLLDSRIDLCAPSPSRNPSLISPGQPSLNEICQLDHECKSIGKFDNAVGVEQAMTGFQGAKERRERDCQKNMWSRADKGTYWVDLRS